MLTFLQFQATRHPCANLADHVDLSPDYFVDADNVPRVAAGFTYDGSAYIETLADGSHYLAIENEEYASADLATLERTLYEWCVVEDFFGDLPDVNEVTLADAFTRAIRAKLTPEQLQAVQAVPADAPYCATHDYCDANQVMLDTYAEMYGFSDYEKMDESVSDNELFDPAWDICRANNWNV